MDPLSRYEQRVHLALRRPLNTAKECCRRPCNAEQRYFFYVWFHKWVNCAIRDICALNRKRKHQTYYSIDFSPLCKERRIHVLIDISLLFMSAYGRQKERRRRRPLSSLPFPNGHHGAPGDWRGGGKAAGCVMG